MTLRSRLIRAEGHEWDEWLQLGRSDVFHTAGYHLWAQDLEGGEPWLAVVGDRDRGLAWPYLLRHLSDIPGCAGWEGTDVHSVYGYPGPVAWGCGPGDPFVAEAWEAIRGIWRDQDVVCAFTRFHPLLGNAELLDGLPGGSLVSEGCTVSVDVTASDDALRAAYGRDLRREIDVARRRGLVTTADEGWRSLETFTDLYRETMLRVGAPTSYFFDEDELRRLHARLPGSVHLLTTRLEDEAAAVGLFTDFEGLAQCFLIGTNDAVRSLSPAKVLLDDGFRWARERGDRVVHIGGGFGGREDSLFWFKSRFSPARHRFATGRWILDAAGYHELVSARHPTRLPEVSFGAPFFPAYRVAGQSEVAGALVPMPVGGRVAVG